MRCRIIALQDQLAKQHTEHHTPPLHRSQRTECQLVKQLVLPARLPHLTVRVLCSCLNSFVQTSTVAHTHTHFQWQVKRSASAPILKEIHHRMVRRACLLHMMQHENRRKFQAHQQHPSARSKNLQAHMTIKPCPPCFESNSRLTDQHVLLQNKPASLAEHHVGEAQIRAAVAAAGPLTNAGNRQNFQTLFSMLILNQNTLQDSRYDCSNQSMIARKKHKEHTGPQ